MGRSVKSAEVRVALVAGLAITAVAVAAALLHAPATVAGTNWVAPMSNLAFAHGSLEACQPSETLPRGTSAIRLGLEATIGPRVTVAALSGSRALTEGTRGAGWRGGEVEVAVRPVRRTYSNVEICLKTGPAVGRTIISGTQAPATAAAVTANVETLPGRMTIEYLRPGRTWLSLLPAVLRHMGLGRALSGTWIAMPIAALAAAAFALASWAVLRELG